MEITYLTTNKFKVREAKLILQDKYGININIVNPDFEIYEIQAKTCAEVAGFSARYAADKLKKPCLKSDTGLYLDALGGLPGPYNAYFDKQIGPEKFLRMLKEETNRKARLEHCFAYCERRPDIVARLCMVVDRCIDHPEYTAKIKVIPKKDYPVLMPCEF